VVRLQWCQYAARGAAVAGVELRPLARHPSPAPARSAGHRRAAKQPSSKTRPRNRNPATKLPPLRTPARQRFGFALQPCTSSSAASGGARRNRASQRPLTRSGGKWRPASSQRRPRRRGRSEQESLHRPESWQAGRLASPRPSLPVIQEESWRWRAHSPKAVLPLIQWTPARSAVPPCAGLPRCLALLAGRLNLPAVAGAKAKSAARRFAKNAPLRSSVSSGLVPDRSEGAFPLGA